MKQTAVEKLVAHLIEYGFDLSAHKLEIEQAKEIEKQQIIDACKKFGNLNGVDIEDYKQYYNETFKI
jgi:hypothetical protein